MANVTRPRPQPVYSPKAAPKRTDVPPGMSVDIAGFLSILHASGEVFEVRSLKCPHKRGGDYTSTHSGYFTDPTIAQEHAALLEKLEPPGIYVTVNCVRPDLLARSANVISPKSTCTTADCDILRRVWLFIDIDSIRSAGISATDSELQSAIDLARRIRDELAADGWPDALLSMSGNGGYLFYRIELPNDADATDLISRVLRGLAQRYDTADAHVDTSTGNASRTCKLIGTTARKGSDLVGVEGVDDRPHRLSWYEPPTGPLNPVPRDLLEAVAIPAAEKKSPVTETKSGPGSSSSNFERCSAYVLKCPDAIPGQNGHGATLRAACEAYRFGLSDAEATQIVSEFNATKTGGEQWSYHEMAHKLADARRKVEADGEFGIRLREPNGGTTPAPDRPRIYIPGIITSAQLDEAVYEQRFLVAGILAEYQPTVIGGRSKAMKTSVAIDLAISLGTGTPFLGRYETIPSSVLVLSGESGKRSIQETARAVCNARGVHLADARVSWGFKLPSICRQTDMAQLAKVVMGECESHPDRINVVVIDPAYLCLLDTSTKGLQASNLFDMGPILLGLSEWGEKTRTTVILCHHCRKGGNAANQWAPPEREDLSMAGFHEWARQWLLLGRRSAYEQGSGHHDLWLEVGGSAGHGALLGVDIDEGAFATRAAKQWEVSVMSHREVKEQSKRSTEDQRLKKREEIYYQREVAVIKALGQCPDGETKSVLKELSGVQTGPLSEVLLNLVQNQKVEQTTIKKHTKFYDAYKPTGLLVG